MSLNIAKWGEGPFLGLDFEATAANPLEARPIQYCLSYVSRGSDGKFKTDTETRYINPGVEIPEDSFKIHGISNETVEAQGEDPSAAINAIGEAVRQVVDSGGSIVIMNAAYDLTLLDREASRHGITPISETLFNGVRGNVSPVLDPMVLDKRFVKMRRRVSDTQGARCLKTIASVYGLPWDDSKAHDAEYDTLQTVRVVLKMAAVAMTEIGKFIERGWKKEDALRMTETRYLTARQLHESQVGWSQAQSEDLRKYFIKVGKHEAADSVHSEWPYIKPKDEGLF